MKQMPQVKIEKDDPLIEGWRPGCNYEIHVAIGKGDSAIFLKDVEIVAFCEETVKKLER